ncbi:collagen alpha-1(III) chain-like [Bos indicus x Bos taurus]|uniref:collagen alpha-1(III) chain-like n=1 Tax=Bos indicus x Bos taurus TaxID=30522 RepID=UPI000F7D4C11|nr:collagen alpha-1(III) chain-like [Bos indicus x Bos taurus]
MWGGSLRKQKVPANSEGTKGSPARRSAPALGSPGGSRDEGWGRKCEKPRRRRKARPGASARAPGPSGPASSEGPRGPRGGQRKRVPRSESAATRPATWGAPPGGLGPNPEKRLTTPPWSSSTSARPTGPGAGRARPGHPAPSVRPRPGKSPALSPAAARGGVGERAGRKPRRPGPWTCPGRNADFLSFHKSSLCTPRKPGFTDDKGKTPFAPLVQPHSIPQEVIPQGKLCPIPGEMGHPSV